MNLRQLEYFKRIAEVQSMTRAANLLHMTQPNLTRQIQQLEKELGVLLFIRSDKGVALTPAGYELLERADTLLGQVRRIGEDISKYATEPKGDLRIGLPPSLYDVITSKLISEYALRYPEVRLSVTEGLSAALHELVLTGKIDAAVVSDVEPLGLLSSRALLSEQLYLVGSIHSQLEIDHFIDLDSLTKRPMLLTSAPNAMRTLVDRQMVAYGERIQPKLETNSSRLLCDLVIRGIGFTVLPYSAICTLHRGGQLTAAPIKGLEVSWTLVSAKDRSFSLAGHRLRDRLMEMLHQQSRQEWWRGVRWNT
jgi:LysR family nitrogen assimilation transcriptional regulator